MKKILVISLVLMFFSNCTNDEKFKIENKVNEELLVKSSSVNIRESKEYIEFMHSLDEYLSEYENNLIDEDEKRFLTNFNANFFEENDIVNFKFKKVVKNLNLLYIAHGFEQVNEIIGKDIIDINIPDYTQITFGPCENNCINDALDCQNVADAAYAETMAVSAGMWASGFAPAAIAIAAVATISHRTAISGCVRGLNSCMRGC